MSDIDSRIDQMRSLVILAPENKSVVNLLKSADLGDWKWSETNFPAGGYEYGLKRGKDIVAIRYESESSDRAYSSNIVPYDWNHDPQGANRVLQELSNALNAAGIESNIIASTNDLKRSD